MKSYGRPWRLSLALLALVVAGCGDDDDDSGSPAAGTGGQGTDQTGDPFAGIDCSGSNTNTCDSYVCGVKSSYDSVTGSCSTQPSETCTLYQGCIADYIPCVANACPGGTADTTALSTCSTTYSSCLTGAVQGTGGAGGGASTGATGGASNGDPFAGHDCSGSSTNSCDTYVCSVKAAYDSVTSSCATTPSDVCTTYQACLPTYVQCVSDACPGGTPDATAISTCSTEYTTCVSP